MQTLGAESGEIEAFVCLSGECGGCHLTELAVCFTHSLTRERLSESRTTAPGLGRGPTPCPGAEPPPRELTAPGRMGWLLSESEERGQEPADQRPEPGKGSHAAQCRVDGLCAPHSARNSRSVLDIKRRSS